MKDLVLMDINCKDARSFRLVTGKLFLCIKVIIRDLSEISKGGRGVGTEGGSQRFETAGKEGVMKNGPSKGGESCKYVSMIM